MLGSPAGGPLRFLILFSVFLMITGCASEPKQVYPESGWYGQMHRLSEAHLQAMSLISEPQGFSDPARRGVLEKSIQELVQISEGLQADPKAPNVDPLIAFTSKSFASEMRAAHKALLVQDMATARQLLGKSSQSCIACHTRADRGSRDFPLRWTPKVSALNQIQKTEFFLANRQYTTGLKAAEELAGDPHSVGMQPEAWLSVLKEAFAVIIRVKKNPPEAERLAQLIKMNPRAPYYMKVDAYGWQKDIADWKKSKVPTSDKGKLALAIQLIKRGQSGYFQKNSGALVSNLRASGILHELLEHPESEVYDQTLLFAGLVSESLHDTSLARHYFESCIQQSPHSVLAETCFEEYRGTVARSNPYFTESDEEVAKLIDLQRTAEVTEVGIQRSWLERWDRIEEDKGAN